MRRFFIGIGLLLLTGCASNQMIVSGIDERDANEIIVYLASRGIDAQKVVAPSAGVGAATTTILYAINVSSKEAVEAMASLSRVGLPRKTGVTLLQLFAKSGLMSSAMEETVRYQAGLAEELSNTIRKIDGVLDADVQISFPQTGSAGLMPGAPPPKVTAAVYVKHQGVLEDPNSHLEVKIKRLMAASVHGLNYDDVAVISDRSRLSDITLPAMQEMISGKGIQTHASIWGLVMTQSSVTRFRWIFFVLLFFLFLFAIAVSWLIYKFYPQIRPLFSKNEEGAAEL
ncbi:MAG: type III secretion inner membrane ring lipoprotein SctJ [Verrucomicrobiota bacterium]|nr:type III secretion inner membrane ring lipoprotein SctJ [Verrucomicrobiota bacterium]